MLCSGGTSGRAVGVGFRCSTFGQRQSCGNTPPSVQSFFPAPVGHWQVCSSLGTQRSRLSKAAHAVAPAMATPSADIHRFSLVLSSTAVTLATSIAWRARHLQMKDCGLRIAWSRDGRHRTVRRQGCGAVPGARCIPSISCRGRSRHRYLDAGGRAGGRTAAHADEFVTSDGDFLRFAQATPGPKPEFLSLEQWVQRLTLEWSSRPA